MRREKKYREVEKKVKFTPKILLLYIALIIFCIVIIAPLVIVFSSSLRSVDNMVSPLVLFSEFTLDSYKAAYEKMNYPMHLLNSAVTTAGSVIVIVIIASMASYPIARITSKWSKGLYYFFIAGLVIPSQMVIVPVAQTISKLGISNSRFTPMIMFITCSLPFSTFLYAGFMKTVPKEIEEAAYLDGAGLITRYVRVVFPLLKPATISVIITQGMWIWNDYFFPMIFTKTQEEKPLPVAMMRFLGDRENPAQWNVLFAACVLCVIPLVIIFIALQKHFINGVAAGAVKG